MDLEKYIKSIESFEKMQGMILMEFISNLKDMHKIEIDDEESLFYAKGFYEEEITDKLYYFGKERIKIITLNKEELNRKLVGVTITNKKTSSVVDVELTLSKGREIELQIKFEDGANLIFHNKKDSGGREYNFVAGQIRGIYNLLTE